VNPVVSAPEGTKVSGIVSAAVGTDDFSDDSQFDLGLRLAVSQLIPGRNKRAVVFITGGDPGPEPFKNYKLNDLLFYMKNNGILFYAVYLGNGISGTREELEYLCRETGGKSCFLYGLSGPGSIIQDLEKKKTGNYLLKYVSQSEKDFGNAFIPVEIEIFLFNRTGRDESGYFAPLEF